jgi:hypothetical protein
MVASTKRWSGLVDAAGDPLVSEARQERWKEVHALRRDIIRSINARYDAAQTTVSNENHWNNADNLDPHTANSWHVRRRLRSRSRYEVIENNPYLKGTILTAAGDFVGSGPKMSIDDDRFEDPVERRRVENDYWRWAKAIKLRQKLWRANLAKKTDGESFFFAWNNRKLPTKIKLDFRLIETDQVTSESVSFKNAAKVLQRRGLTEIDGVRLDENGEAVEYCLLKNHPGASYPMVTQEAATWINEKFVLHWMRKDRGWHRGIPETTPSLPLCALLRRYTLAVVKAAETAAAFSAILETEGPPNGNVWPLDEEGQPLGDDPFDMFPIEHGMFTTMPWGYKMKQLAAEQPTTMYDAFVSALLREIVRPLLVPFNIAAGSSQDSNMASAVVDAHFYKSGQMQERLWCEEDVLDKSLGLWWEEYKLVHPRYRDFEGTFDHLWNWDPIGLDHTDPQKVWGAIEIAHKNGFMTDKDIQETRFNRDVETWKKQIEDDQAFREKVKLPRQSTQLVDAADAQAQAQKDAADDAADDKPRPKKPAGKKKAKKKPVA